MSQPVVEIAPAALADVPELLAGLRACDRLECERMVGAGDVAWVTRHTVESSLMAWTARANGALACMFGVVPLSITSAVGIPWLLGTNTLDVVPRAVVRHSRRYIAQMAAVFPRMTNFVDADNVVSQRWLQHCGFVLCEHHKIGPKGHDFIRFELRS